MTSRLDGRADRPASDRPPIQPDHVAADGRYCVFSNVLEETSVAGLMDYVERRQDDFYPATVYSRVMSKRVDPSTRDCLQLRDLGPFRAVLAAAVEARIGAAARALGVDRRNLEPAEFEICAYGDKGAFHVHTDNRAQAGAGDVRVLTCVYYFSETPPRFGGGALRVHPWPVGAPGLSREVLDVPPTPNTMVLFPSMLPHEVAPVQLQDDAWRARRFNITCWLWRRRSGLSESFDAD